jgi:thiamine-monophosphate kinase
LTTLREIGEFEAIRRLTRSREEDRGDRAAAPRAGDAHGVILGAGDDAAVLRPAEGLDLVATTDAFVERVHYDPALLSPREIGARLAAACVSDLAAMAARPRWALHSIGARGDHDVDALIDLQRGIADALATDGAIIVGGNLAAVEDEEWMSLTVLGEVARGHARARAGGVAGDLIAMTGRPGRAAAGLALTLALGRDRPEEWRELIDAWIRPASRVAAALALEATGFVHAAIDVSDGFAADLHHLCEASGVGGEVEERALLDDPPLARAAAKVGRPIERFLFGPSDDYELLLAIDPAGRARCEQAARGLDVRLEFIGRLVAGAPRVIRVGVDGSRRPLDPRGWDHYQR